MGGCVGRAVPGRGFREGYERWGRLLEIRYLSGSGAVLPVACCGAGEGCLWCRLYDKAVGWFGGSQGCR